MTTDIGAMSANDGQVLVSGDSVVIAAVAVGCVIVSERLPED